MNVELISKSAFSVIGREGSTADGEGFVQQLWAEANAHFDEVAPLVKRDENGGSVGFWGAMTDFSRSFRPWEKDFSQGLYLAGVECNDDAQPPEGWVRWDIPAFSYLRAECTSPTLFSDMLAYLDAQNLKLAGAVQDFADPKTGKNYMYFPIRTMNSAEG